MEGARQVRSQSYGMITSSFFLSGRYKIGETVSLAGEIPIGVADYGGTDDLLREWSGIRLGSPYVGIVYDPDSRYVFEVGARLPVANLLRLGSLGRAPSDLFEETSTLANRPAAFQGDRMTIHAQTSVFSSSKENLFQFRLRGGPVVGIPVEGDASWFVSADVDASGWWLGEYVDLGAHLTNRTRLGSVVFGGGFLNLETGLSGYAKLGPIHPGVSVRVPFAEGRSDFSAYTISMMVRVPLP